MELMVTTSTDNHPRDYRAVIIVAALVALAINGALVGWGFWVSSQLGHVQLSNLHVFGDTELCPGELLVYEYTMKVTRPATVDLHTTIERLEPTLKRISDVTFTSLQQFRTYDTQAVTLRRNVYFADTYTDPETGQQKTWQPGEYRQRTTASVIWRSEFSEIEVPFTVRQNCAKKPKE